MNNTWSSLDQVYIPTTIADFQETLDPGTTLLYYMVAADHTDLLVLTSTGRTSSYRVPLGISELDRELSHLVVELGAHSTRGALPVRGETLPPAQGVNVARRLFRELIAPAEREIASANRLLIIPDGPLHRLPFAALKRINDDGREQYLAEWKPLHFAPSAATYAALVVRRNGKRDQQPRGSLVAFGNPDYDRTGRRSVSPFVVRSAVARGFSGRLDELPGSEREVREIGKLFDAKLLDNRVFVGPDAEESRAKHGLEGAAYLHFAVHGFVDSEQPESSFLALALPASFIEGEDNGILEGWEIIDQMKLNAELVALSACETAVGLERSGEGPASLNRAFLAAGARSVLAALWKVDDSATAELMIRVYRHLLAGKSKDEALHAAQLELLRHSELRYAAPYYWAGFQVSGDRI